MVFKFSTLTLKPKSRILFSNKVFLSNSIRIIFVQDVFRLICTNYKFVSLDETVQFTDRPNSTEAEQNVTSYVYPVEQEFWEVEDLDDPHASQVRWRHLYTQLNLRSSEDPPSQKVARMHQNRPLNRLVLLCV